MKFRLMALAVPVLFAACADASRTPTQPDVEGAALGAGRVANVTQQTFASGSHVKAWGPIYQNYGVSWPTTVCTTQPPVALTDSRWGVARNATSFGPSAHPWQNQSWSASWINAWTNINSSGGPGYPGSATSPYGHNWSKYETEVSGNGSFVLSLLADNCSWIYLDGTLVGVQGTTGTQTLSYGVTLTGTHTLTFMIFDGGGLAGGMFRMETTTNPPAPLNPDLDGDGYPNTIDAFSLDPAEWADTDGDGHGDNGDAFPDDPSEWLDSDDDGVGDNRDAYPLDPTRYSLDNTPPSVTPVVTGTMGTNGWYTSDVSVSWTLTDGESTVTSKPCVVSHVTTDTPSATFTCTATSAGGTADGSVTIKRDATPPTVTAAITAGNSGTNGWYTGLVTVHFTCADGGSGVAGCPADQILSNQGANTSASGTATDVAGNTSALSNTVSANIDGVKPVITFSGNAGSYSVDQQVSIACSATDATSGIASSTCPIASGAAYTFSVGSNTLNASATDKAGNQHAASTSFAVTVTSGNICELVKRWVSNAGVANSMCVKLRQGSYGAFRNELSAQGGKKFLSEANAAILLRLVNLLG